MCCAHGCWERPGSPSIAPTWLTKTLFPSGGKFMHKCPVAAHLLFWCPSHNKQQNILRVDSPFHFCKIRSKVQVQVQSITLGAQMDVLPCFKTLQLGFLQHHRLENLKISTKKKKKKDEGFCCHIAAPSRWTDPKNQRTYRTCAEKIDKAFILRSHALQLQLPLSGFSDFISPISQQ